ncbi:hypothetical protein HZC34_03040 [Candidatus Saganbacteria bacterium]|nr:hypothetical protein [Candidatus Saganbacteria bacterium]
MRYFLCLLSIVLLATQALSMGNSPAAPAKSSLNMLENFEDGNYAKDPEWWNFGNIDLSIIDRPAQGKHSLSVKGRASDWYVGGIGVYLLAPDADFSNYSGLEFDVFGSGEKSGTIKIELYDDDNGNNQIEADPGSYAPRYDDKFISELKVDWSGHKHIVIPFSEFIDNNPEAGDNIWNPAKTKTSGGLLQMQFIFLAASKTGNIGLVLDNIGFYKGTK